jgi:uncharacterized membrane protein (DUF373 family)
VAETRSATGQKTTRGGDLRRLTIVSLIARVEDAIHVAIAVLLAGAGLVLLWSVVSSFWAGLGRTDPLSLVLTVLDRGLILFMIAELLYTVRITIRDRSVAAEPFLIVGLIAAIRRVLILTAQVEHGFTWASQGMELSILVALILVMSIALLAWRRTSPRIGSNRSTPA